MGAAYFYHLTRRPLVETLRMLLDRSLANGWRVAVRCQDKEALEALDRALWLQPEDGFLPHGVLGGPHDADQPVLFTTGDAPNAPQCVMTVHGADVSAAEVAAFDRVCILFDGNDVGAVQHARGQWKALADAGAEAKYWSEESGNWEMKAETGG